MNSSSSSYDSGSDFYGVFYFLGSGCFYYFFAYLVGYFFPFSYCFFGYYPFYLGFSSTFFSSF